MGLVNPRPAMRGAEERSVRRNLEAHAIRMKELIASGMDAQAASKQALQDILKKPVTKKCRCRAPKKSIDCAYCGTRCLDIDAADHVCGVCHENGIDGKVIRGTGRVVCALHKV